MINKRSFIYIYIQIIHIKLLLIIGEIKKYNSEFKKKKKKKTPHKNKLNREELCSCKY